LKSKCSYLKRNIRANLFISKSDDGITQVYLLLKNGYSLKEINELLPAYAMTMEEILKHSMVRKYGFLLKEIDLQNLLYFSLKRNKFRKNLEEKLRKNLTYPIVLMLTSLMISYFFIHFLIPQIMNSFSEFEMQAQFQMFIDFIRIIQKVLFLFLFLISTFLIICRNHILKILLYSFSYKKFSKTIFFDWISLEFANLLSLLYQSGLSIQECFKAIHILKRQVLLSNISYHILTQLEEGKSLRLGITNAKITKELKAYFLIAIESGDFIGVLNDYLEFKELSFQKRLNKIAQILQLSSYLYISILLIIMYQIIFLPMQLINQF